MRAFARSFQYAFRGLALCLRERNFRFQLAFAAYMYGFLLLYDWFALGRAEWAVLVLSTALVLAAEAVNTAVETLVDLSSPGLHPLAARAKDIAAGTVLLCAAGAVAVGFAVLWQPEAFRAMAEYYKAKPWMLGVLGLSGIAAGVFVFGTRGKRK
jgi:diacylglycerol kinase